jgi:ComF family protein
MCGLPLTSVHDWVCGVCLHKPPAWDRSVAALAYRFPVDQLVLRFKFSRSLACGEVLGRELLAAVLSSDAPLPECIIPVPLHKTRLFLRSYNQADLLAGMVGKPLGIPVVRGVLRRTRRTQAQSDLDAASRKKNIRGAFSCRPLADLAQAAHIGLVDDVCTTGETLAACTRTLKAAGAERVSVWVAARAPPP